MSSATPAKLKNGQWGAKAQGRIQAGDTITITTRGGKSWDAKVSRVLWSDGKITLCSTSKTSGRSSRRSSRRSSGTCSVSGCQSPATVGGMCKRCDFDENDC